MNAMSQCGQSHRSARRGFSLIEVLLAIFILGIGIISIAALFPAGIAQQRLANEDVMGPIVANNAIAIIRSKVRQEDFGSYHDFNEDFLPPRPTLDGDWPWMRPSFLLGDDSNTPYNETGAIDIFSNRLVQQELGGPNPKIDEIPVAAEWYDLGGWPVNQGVPPEERLWGIPYNVNLHGGPPRFIITQEERYYPMASTFVQNQDPPRPQYVWDCMFRRYQGRIQVAIFVYRVTAAGGDPVRYRVSANPDPDAVDLPPMPATVDLFDDNNIHADWYSAGVWDVNYDGFVPGNDNPADYDPFDRRQSWQEPRQWLLDQNNNIHRVLARDNDPATSVLERVELTRPLLPVSIGFFANNTLNDYPNVPSDVPQWYLANPLSDSPVNNDLSQYMFDRGVVTDIWYIPRHIEDDLGNELTLTPVYVTVKEL